MGLIERPELEEEDWLAAIAMIRRESSKFERAP
jgi:hypothetical protein